MVVIAEERPGGDELLALYRDVGWTAYTRDPETLVAAVLGSHLVLTARDTTGSLVGMVRTVSDGVTIVYVQDVLVAPEHHRAGIGGALLDGVLERYAHVRQTVLTTDAEPGQRAFYESRGFVEVHDVVPTPLRSFVLLR
ncbi:GNAT family N-acetyltransferase [Curtobacterium sp. BH-2-1-1]|uniref:GNAT family N-acetyltransferase n=1 Tax=Curtobacterium sp. BH-2-1-1 TaxID=1905847 RepID=UPI00089DEA84|nr:GNAT family N-acetyltransferase [Curtobacterium sp. BH-2-1-1]AOX65614.1 GNAT family N-acetyltransferase [Curtobacterium sp. BH-2-1-1]